MAVVGEFIRKSRLERLEDHQAQVERFIVDSLNELKREIVNTRHAQEFIYRTFMAHTWRGRFRRLVAWINKPKKQRNGRQAQKGEAAVRSVIQTPERAGGTK